MSEDTADLIYRFVRDGYVVLRGAVPLDTVERLDAELRSFWERPPTGLLVETFEPDDKLKIVPPRPEFRDGRTKMLDVYAFSVAAREAIANGPTVAFLAAIFEQRPKAFQSLSFWKGSQQAMHKDTAYVKVAGNPLALAATWLALEEISAGTGELEYYVGSHHAPDFKFLGVSKWVAGPPAEHKRFLDCMHEDATRYGYPRRSFTASPGDVLIWHADLAHGGSKIKYPERTRRSLVTHFTGEAFEPYYERRRRACVEEMNGCLFETQYYDLSNKECAGA